MSSWMTLDQLASEFGIAKHTLQNRLSRGTPMPPSYYFGRKRFFKREEVYAWIEKTRTETTIPSIG